MFSFIKWLFFALILLLAVAIAVPVAATFLVKQETVKNKIESWFLENTGRALSITGNVGFEPGLEIRLFAENVELQNPKWAGRPLAFSARRAELTIALLPLFERQIEVNSLMLAGADLWVEHDEIEGSNLKLLQSDRRSEKGRRPAPPWFGIKRIDIADGQILVPERRSDRITTIKLAEASLVSDSLDSPVIVDASGSINGLRVNLAGTASTLASVLSRNPTIMDLVLTTPGGDKVTAVGNVNDVLGWRGIQAQIGFDLPSVPNLSPLFTSRPMDIRMLSGTAQFRQPDTVSTMVLGEITGRFEYLDLSFSLNGSIGRLSKLEQFDLIIAAEEKPDLSSVLGSRDASLLGDLSTELSVSLELSGSARRTRIEIDRFEASLGNAEISALGGFLIKEGNWDTPIQVRASIPDLIATGERFGLKLPNIGQVTVSGLLSRSDRQFGFLQVNVKNDSEDISVAAAGELENLGRDMEGRIQFTGSALAPFFTQSFFQLPLLPNSAEAGGTVTISSGQPLLNIDAFTFELPGGVLEGKGTMDGLKKGSEIQLQVNSRIDEWDALAQAIEKPLPDMGRALFTAELTGQFGEVVSLTNIQGEVEDSEKQGSIRGSLSNLGKDMQGDLLFSALLPQQELAQLFESLTFAKDNLSDNESAEVSGNLLRSAEGEWSLKNLIVDAQVLGVALDVTGDLTQLSPAKGRIFVSMAGDLKPGSLPAGLAVRKVENVNLSFELPVDEDGNRIEQLRGLLRADSGEMRVNATRVEFVDGIRGLFDIQLEVLDLATATASIVEFRENVPLNADIKLEVQPGRWLASTTLISGENDFEGTIAFNHSLQRPRLEIDGGSTMLDVDKLLSRPPREDRFFSEKPLLPEWMSRFDGAINLTADRFSNQAVDLDALDASIRYDEGKVAVRLSASRGGGNLVGNFDFPVDRNSRLQVISNKLPVTAFRSLMRRDIFQGGVVDIHVNLAGPGRNLSDILSGGQGVVGLDINDSSIKGTALDSVGGDIFSNLLRIFNPFIKKDKLVNLDCGAVRFDVRDGKAITRNGLAMKTDRVTLLGAGELTFRDEGLKLEIAPKPRKGFGISASSFAKMIRLGGTLSDPDVEASATGFFKSGAAIGAAIFSGGLSLIGQGMLDRLAANANVCALARGEVEKLQETFNDVQNR